MNKEIKNDIINDIETIWVSKTYAKQTGCGKIYIIVAYKINEPNRVDFIKIFGCTKTNDCLNSNMEALSDLLTFAIRRIRNKYEADAIIKACAYHRCNKVIPNQEHIVSCVDAVSKVLLQILNRE
ncbi:MAG: hypothetical protein QXS18_04955 [Thermoplasmata archaeon]